MQKYIESYRTVSSNRLRACHPSLKDFYNSCDYLDRKALKKFLSTDLVPTECSPAERTDILKSILEELLRG